MKRILLFIGAFFVSVASVDAAERSAKSITRDTSKNTVSRTSTPTEKKSTRGVTARSTARTTVARTNKNNQSTARTGRNTKTVARTAQPVARTTRAETIAHSAGIKNTNRLARATISLPSTPSNTFGTSYNSCRDAYFTCMDQFCATADDAYRRCVCSGKLSEIQSRERALSQTSDQIQDFKDLNISVITKTAQEVNAMLSATEGELIQENTVDKSDSAKQLSGISAVLSKTKKKSLSTQGTLDIAGDINAIWSTTSLTGGSTIANLTGEPLYNAVHAQCSEMVMERCGTKTNLDMVVSAYGMYIENDCSAIINSLDKKLNAANSTIRETERQMNEARLENYNAHNSKSINDCIAQVRIDITGANACGTDYVHCLDITGRYLNYNTGEPIYTPEFYKLANQVSLSGDVLTNETNRMLVATLNNKREYAKRGLDTCRDLADEVWDEFMRQAITEIYQGQQERIRLVKNECLEVVTTCYDEQSQSLKDFSNVDEQLLLGSRMELSEQLCREKLDTCSNLYGNGSNGMQELLTAMHNITDAKIAKQCVATLQDYAKDICAVPGNDTKHAYPYGCKTYVPSEQRYAAISGCNDGSFSNTDIKLELENNPPASTATETTDISNRTRLNGNWSKDKTYYQCSIKYIYCKPKYYLENEKCLPCPTNCICEDGKSKTCPSFEQITTINFNTCGDYEGSLYQKMVRYASQACVRPSEATNPLPDTILQDINTVMTQLRADMAQQLATECERWDGEWVDTVWTDTDNDNKHDTTGHTLNSRFYRETNASTKWGFCGERTIDTAEPYKYEITLKNKVGDYQTCSNPSPPEDSYIYVAYGETMPPIGQVIDGKPAKIGIPICNNTLNKYEFAGYKNKNGELIYNASGNPQIPTWNQQSDATLEAQWVNKD